MREVSRHLFIPRRPLIASMLASDPERSWIRIVKASLISSTRPALTSASAPFAMTRRFPLPARRSFASMDRVMGSISGLWLPPPASSAAAIFARFSQMSIYQHVDLNGLIHFAHFCIAHCSTTVENCILLNKPVITPRWGLSRDIADYYLRLNVTKAWLSVRDNPALTVD
jgi:hypothetical protein